MCKPFFDPTIKLKDNAMLKIKPELFDEWDFEENNKLGLDIYKMSKGSHKKVNWICEFGHKWMANIDSRARLNSNCPTCSGRVASKENNLLAKKTKLCEEWDYEKNKKTPDQYKPNSSKKVWWICKNCKSSFESIIANRNKGIGCPFCTGQKVNETNCLVTKNPKLASEWHPTKNGKLTPNEVVCNARNKAWWLGKCGHEWEAAIYSRNIGVGCPYCSGKKIDETNSLFSLKPEVAKYWHTTKNRKLTPNDVTCGSGKKVWWFCDCGNEYEMAIDYRVKTFACPKCTKYEYKVIEGVNDMWTTNPELAFLLSNPEDGHKYTQSSGQKVDWKCPNCGEIIKNKAINHINKRGFKCPTCDDGMSFPERFLFHLFTEMNIDFIHDKSTEWSNNRRYDFRIPLLNTIVEIHGSQHFKKGFQSLGGRTLEEEQENDEIKRILALSNGIKNYIIIDSIESDFEYIKNNVLKSDIAKLFNLKNINWDKVNKKTQSSILFRITDLWNIGYSIKGISNEVDKNRNTVTKFLNIGDKLNMCNYSIEESYRRGYLDANYKGKIVVQLTLNLEFINEFESIAKAKRETKVDHSSINMCCRGKRKTAGGFKWMYKEDYENMKKDE